MTRWYEFLKQDKFTYKEQITNQFPKHDRETICMTKWFPSETKFWKASPFRDKIKKSMSFRAFILKIILLRKFSFHWSKSGVDSFWYSYQQFLRMASLSPSLTTFYHLSEWHLEAYSSNTIDQQRYFMHQRMQISGHLIAQSSSTFKSRMADVPI